MPPDQTPQQLEAAIAALEAQRAALGDALIDQALTPLRARLASLTSAVAPSAQTRRLVTVLFLDVIGSTALSRELDPEDTHEMMDGALARCTAIVQAHGGKVLQYAGDSLLAVFGADAAREDDAVRAVEAGLDLAEESGRQEERVRQRWGLEGFALRVGAHTGSVLLGGGVDAENTIRGLTVNMAARMEQAAPPGTLRISRSTWQHVRGLFEMEEQAPLWVKGAPEPLVTYLVSRQRPRSWSTANRGIEGVATPLVGRDAELAALRSAVERAVQERAIQACLLVAEAGLGKSRLLAELQHGLGGSPPAPVVPVVLVVLVARAQPGAEYRPYGLLREMLAAHWAITDGDDAETTRRKLLEGLVPLIGDEAARRLGHFAGFDFSASPPVAALAGDARELRDRAFAAMRELLTAMGRDSTVVLLLDDLHWADDGSLDLVAHLAQAGLESPLALLMAARPTLLERRPAWPGQVTGLQVMTLGLLDAGHSQSLAGALLQRMSDVPASLRDLVVHESEGNPFYMEELVLMLIDDGALVADSDGRWRAVPERLGTLRMPTTLTGVLQARLDALRPPQKRSLQQASAIGPVFWDEALASIDPAAPAELPPASLVLRRANSAFDNTVERAFVHHLLHQVTYDTVLKRDREAYHAHAARWLSARVADRPSEFLAVTAEHFERAGDRAEASRYFGLAAEAAAARFDNASARSLGQRSLDLLPPSASEPRWDLLRLLHRVADLQGDRAAQDKLQAAMAQVLQVRDDVAWQAELAYCRSLLADRRADFPAQIEHARACLALAEPAGLWGQVASARLEWAIALRSLGDTDAARVQAQSGLIASRRSQEVKTEAQLLCELGSIDVVAGRLPSGIAHLTEGLALARTAGFRRLEGVLLGNLSSALCRIGDFDTALPHVEAGLAISRAIGNPAAEAMGLATLSPLRLCLGQAVAAAADARDVVRLSQQTGDKFVEAHGHLSLGEALAAVERWEEAERSFAASIVLFEQMEMPMQALQVRGRRAEAAVARGEAALALGDAQAIATALADDTLPANLDEPYRLELACHRAFALAGDPRARAWLERAHAHLMEEADRLDPAARAGFLANVPWNRELVSLWSV
jgi:class 3 adenylate cyclase